MAGYAKLIPAFHLQVVIEPPKQVGAVARNGGLVLVKLIGGAGFMRSAEGYPIALDAVIEHGADYIRVDANSAHVRLDTLTTLTDEKTGGLVRLHYTGVIPMSGPAGKILGGAPDAKTTDFGEAFIQCTFETGSPELKAMESKIYVGSGRFILEEGKPVIVEYMISEVAQ